MKNDTLTSKPETPAGLSSSDLLACPWTRFMDMHSGGGIKEAPWQYIYIQAPEDEARKIFYNRFGHSPERVSCTCCGEDYAISEAKTLARCCAYDRGCKWEGDDYIEEWCGKEHEPYLTVEEYSKKPCVLVIPANGIKDSERGGEVPEQGYVWRD